MKKLLIYICFPALFLAVLSCTPDIPQCGSTEEDADIFPDYRETTVPPNIAPLNYMVRNDAEKILTRVCGPDGKELVISGRKVKFPLKEWRKLLSAAKSKELTFETYLYREGQWSRLKDFSCHVAREEIDGWLTYRFLAPSYEFHSYLSIDQRDVTSFRSREIYHNRFEHSRTKQQCINCHSFQNYHTDRWQLHVRLIESGTIIVDGADGGKVDLKTEQTISGGFYPAWHPTENLIVYSNNWLRQFFFARNYNRIEQQDNDSDLIMYDVAANVVTPVAKDSVLFENYPAWAPDGRTLYYSCASQPELRELSDVELGEHFEDFKYDILKRSFDPSTKQFGPPQMVMDARAMDKSALFPRISPDGRRMLVAVARFGSCHNYHRDSDLWMMDLSDGSLDKLELLNSDEADSYHNWSSNGRWIIFTSRRMDGVHTRIFISYFDENGKAHKPFVLPQEDPEHYIKTFKSYSVPEPTVEPLRQSIRQVRRIVRQDARKATYLE
ncbi:MAG: hypothetical protein MJY70_03800 [Bacteroidales bacterium]|nr:hypothetical protein [Bacteroidales bacterium]